MRNKRFEECFLEYKDLIVRVVMKRTGDYQMAQEICQQIFVAFYANMDKIQPDMTKAWLIRSTKNAVVDYYRRKSVRDEIIDEYTPLHELGSTVAEPVTEAYEEKYEKKELAGRIFKELKSVNENWYEAMVLVCVEGLSYTEAAEKLNISENLLRSRICRARTYIKQHFGEEYMGYKAREKNKKKPL